VGHAYLVNPHGPNGNIFAMALLLEASEERGMTLLDNLLMRWRKKCMVYACVRRNHEKEEKTALWDSGFRGRSSAAALCDRWICRGTWTK
jgi:hypothetical protein